MLALALEKEELLSSARRAERELAQASRAVSATCLSTSVPHSLGTCLETGNYTTGGGGVLPERGGGGPRGREGVCREFGGGRG